MIKKLEQLFDYKGDAMVVAQSSGSLAKAGSIEKIIGISGGADQPEIEHAVMEIIDNFLAQFQPYNKSVAIVTGGTQYSQGGIPIFGIPAYATKRAYSSGFFTIGVFPERGEKYTHELGDNLDIGVKVLPRYGESGWGDEIEILGKIIDATMIIGGSEGTSAEFFHVAKHNRTRLDHKEIPIFVVPISGIGGISELIPNTANIFKQSDKYLPQKPITQGEEAATYLINKMGI